MIYDSSRGPLRTKSVPYDSLCSDVVSQDADLVLKAVLKVGRELAAGYSIDIICLSSTWHSLLVVDKDLKPKARALSWAYTGAAEETEKIRRNFPQVLRHYHNTGGIVHTAYPLFKLLHFENDGMSIFPGDRIIDLGSYIFSKLTSTVAQSLSMASGSGFLNINTLDWDPDALALSKTQKENFPELVDHTYTRPLALEYAYLLGVKEGIPVVASHPDGALNQVGSGALGNGIMTLSVGTSGAIRMAYDRPYFSGTPSTWCYYAPGKWLVGAATSGSTNCLDWYAGKVMLNGYLLHQLDDMVAGDNEGDPPIFLPFLFGERCPGWDERRSGGFIGIKATHTAGTLYRSILEGILFNLYQCYEILIKTTSSPEVIKVSGGIIKSPLWLQMLPDIFQKDMLISKNEQASMLGAAGLGMLALGEISSLEEFNPGREAIVSPNCENREKYQHRYHRYLEFYHKTV